MHRSPASPRRWVPLLLLGAGLLVAVLVLVWAVARPSVPETTTAPSPTAPGTPVAASSPGSSMQLPGIDGYRTDAAASNELLREPASAAPQPSGTGEVRITCGVSHYAYDDPIVYPGQAGASHLHAFIGNAGTDADSTYDSLRDESRGSTCAGGSANKSAYWMPALVDTAANAVVEPELAFVYYKTGYWGQDAEQIADIPDGLRMISGVGDATEPQPEWIASWSCSTHDGFGVPLETITSGPSIPDCPPGELLEASVMFPQCWNGVDLDSPDHQSHLSHPDFDGACPPGYPVLLPQITLHVTWVVGPDRTGALALANDMMTPEDAPPGQGLHADFMDGWDPDLRVGIVENCLRERLDCGVRSLGDGYDLLDP